MRIISRALLCASLLATPLAAQNSGPASNGDFTIALTGMAGAIQYNARSFGNEARGEMTFTGAAQISSEDVDGEGTAASTVTSVTLKVTFDCLRISGHNAAMSGVVTSSTVPEYLGVRAVLAVQDNGEGINAPAPDKFTWGLYRHSAHAWIPSDAEVPGDNGATLTWIATDAERTDDAGVPSNHSTVVDCNSFPFGSYAFEELPHGAGQIQVKP